MTYDLLCSQKAFPPPIQSLTSSLVTHLHSSIPGDSGGNVSLLVTVRKKVHMNVCLNGYHNRAV
jgi:hypothetical protein